MMEKTISELEEMFRTACSWVKENGYSIERRSAYSTYCTGTRALMLHNKCESLNDILNLLGVTSEWMRAFGYGFEGTMPHLRGLDGACLEKPAEAFQLGQKLGLEFCGPTSWKFDI